MPSQLMFKIIQIIYSQYCNLALVLGEYEGVLISA